MNQKAIYRSIWEKGTVETNCEITPKGEIINIETAEPQFDAETLLAEEVSLCMADVTVEVVSNSDGASHAKDFHPLLRYLVLSITNVPFPDGNRFGGFAIYDALLDTWVADPANHSCPYVCAGGVKEGQQLAMCEDLSIWQRVHDSLGISKSQSQSIRIVLPVFDISMKLTEERQRKMSLV